MTTAVLCSGVTAAQTLVNGSGNVPTGSQVVNPSGGSTATNPPVQSFQLLVTCSAGNCSATAQVIVSNDGVNWSNYGSAISASSGVSPNTAIANNSQPFQYYSAYITAISGTNAKASVTMGS